MKTFTHNIITISAILVITFAGCGGNNNNPNENKSDSATAQNNAGTLDPNASALVKVNNRLFSVPSPVQLATIIKNNNLPYNKELLNPASKRQDYTTAFKQSLNCGVYGANLGYINIYEQLPDAAAYFGAIRSLSRDLGIMNAFNESTMKRIEENNGNKDSLLYIASVMYRESDSYLMNADRNETGVLIIAGGFVEGLYLLTHITDGKLPDAVKEKIGEQKNPLYNLIELLRPYYNKINNDYDVFLEELSELASVFDEINVEYTYKPSQTFEDKKLTIVNSTSKTDISDKQIEIIKSKVEKLRIKITD